MNKKIITTMIMMLASITLCACNVTPQQGNPTRNEPGKAVEDTQGNVSDTADNTEDSKEENVTETKKASKKKTSKKQEHYDINYFLLTDSNNPGEYVECFIDGNMLGIKRANYYSTPEYSYNESTTLVELSNNDMIKLQRAVSNLNGNKDAEKALELDISNLMDTSVFDMLYYDYNFGNDKEKKAAEQRVNEQIAMSTAKQAEKDSINQLLYTTDYIIAPAETRTFMATNLMQIMKDNGWIKEYVADTTNNVVVYTDVYGSLCSLKTSSWEPYTN